jgi:CDP-diacylglycerol--serine O-phosphatidyltransferase
MLRTIKNNIPNAITSVNLVSGMLAIVASFHSREILLWGLPGYQVAYLCIALGAVADFLDGLVARLLHSVSGIGKELDSLSDLVTFGIAPAMIVYNLLAVGHDPEYPVLGLLALLLGLFGALRLARFNVDPNQATTFTGLPIPANAIFWIGFTAWYAGYDEPLWIVLVVIVLLSLLMVCNLRMFSLKMHNLSSLKQNWAQYLQVIATVAFVVLMGLPGLAAAITLYVLLSIVKREK